MSEDGPPLFRPIPRRPFPVNINLTTATPPEDDEDDSAGLPPSKSNLDLFKSRFLNVGYKTPTEAGSSISRPPSYMNLTSSTLYGIYSPTTTSRAFHDRDEDDTPWGTGAQTPIRRPTLDDVTYELMKERSHLGRRPSVYRTVDTTIPHAATPASASHAPISTTRRAALLLSLGVGYGMVLTRLQDNSQWPSLPAGMIQPRQDMYYLAFWGISGVVLGSLLPWIDNVWESTFGREVEDDASTVDAASSAEPDASTDWTLVMRAIGAFVGIVFAIRKLTWTSSLQASLALALVNPLLWWIIDRSKAGFMLSTMVAVLGSAVFLGVNPDMMPAPSGLFHPGAGAGAGNSSYAIDSELYSALSGIASQETVEAGVWMLSVLFCSSICFGNIGRRLVSEKTGVGKGRWAGTQ
ncbi:unnamed protein product [Clonostachys rosea f. rosea IK726]|uniref:Uncharacterized protein n=2 Tax=Bionectria ochroleuca TaxID=29856 RepID=A0ACA9TUT5_BIOOC|nr:unnamed protein product [Clonostachys rosea f. rosea IK726]